MRHVPVVMLILLAFLVQSACAPMRFVVDVAPVTDELTETVVLEDDDAGWGASKVAMIDVSGVIYDAERPGLIAPGENPVSTFVEALRKAKDDSRIKAVIVRLNSPGGTVTASDVLYREVRHFRQETGKPVVMLMGDVAASGAYYVACAGDEVIAAPTTVTGSIGVIMQMFNFSEGMRKIGIRAESITSGPNKAMGSPFEPMPEEHRRLIQELVNEFYARFLAVVKESRPGLSPADLEWVTDGRVISGARAAEAGLVDSTGDLRDAFAAAKRRADISSAKLVKYHRPVDYVGSPYARSPAASTQVNLLQLNLDGPPGFDRAGFYYLWDPTVEW